MFEKGKYAWVTAVVDETTAMEGIIFAKSLSRIITVGTTIVLVPEDIADDLGKTLAGFFDVVFPVDIREKERETQLAKLDILKLYAWNLEMYSKLIVASPNNMVLKNCDDLFDFSADILLTKKLNTSVFAIKPRFQIYKSLLKLSRSKQYRSLSELFASHFGSSKNNLRKEELSPIYNVTITDIANNHRSVEDAAIIVIGKKDILQDLDSRGTTMTTAVKDIWVTHWNEVHTEVDPELPRKLSNPRFLQNIAKSNYYKNSIAIVGYSCRFPAANNIEEFWELLKNGGDGISSIPPERLADHQLNDPRITESKGGFLKCPIDEFDTNFFGISPREVVFMDPQQRLLMEVAWEALENAAINPQTLKGSNTGLFTGVWTTDYEKIISANSSSNQDFHHVYLGNAFSATSARVSYFLGLNGPNVATESGCSSSMVALHLACESLRKGETNLGLVMGSNVIVNITPFREIPILAVDGHCKTYDEKADGFGRAEGVAVLVLKMLPDAIKNGDRVMAIIRGSGISSEGTSSSFGTPSKLCQEIAVKDALKNANIKPEEVDYVEAHGTGTPVGDPIEFAAISSAYSGKREKPLVVGSVKTNIGHTEATAGLAGIIKVILAMQHELIPPHKNFKNLNPNINLNTVPSVIPVEPYPWCSDLNRVRKAGVSSFGISGTNVHVILEEAPAEKDFQPLNLNMVSTDDRENLLTLSAKSKNALIELVGRYIQFLDGNSGVDIRDLTFTANSGRAHLKHRIALIGSSINEIKSNLEQAEYLEPVLVESPRIAFLFTGQGSQYFGMAKTLYECNFEFQNSFNDCATIIEALVGIKVKDALWNENFQSALEQTAYSQLSIFAVEYALVKLWNNLGIKPDYVLGHSVGEFCASVQAGILDLKDAILLLAERSKLIQSLPVGGMLAVRSSKEKVSELISRFLQMQAADIWLDIAAINSQDEIVVTGNKSTIETFGNFCVNNGTQCQTLSASQPFHSRAMVEIMPQFGEFARKIEIKPPSCQYVSSTTGNLLSNGEMDNGTYWVRHAREPVNFLKGMKTLQENGCTVFIEIGAHPILLALGMSSLKNSEKLLWLPSLRRNTDDLKTFLGSLGTFYKNGGDVQWANLYRHERRKKLELPSYPFQRKKYWIDNTSDNVSKQIHPLLGRKLILAGENNRVYTGKWNLRDFQYLKDHVVADVVVLPGAGFLEILIAAAKDILSKDVDSKFMKIEDFVVEAPLELEEEKTYNVQVVASTINENHHHMKIYVYKTINSYSDEKGWKTFATGSAKFYDKGNMNLEAIVDSKYSAENLTDIKIRCKSESSAKQFYEKVQDIGICFGETFKSIESFWPGDKEILSSISLPTNAGTITDYIYHPIILDAMFQTLGFSVPENDAHLYLPVGIDHIYLFSGDLTEVVFAHAKWGAGDKKGTVALYNSRNDLLAVIVGLTLLRTNVNSFINGINSQKNILPDMFQEVWRPRLGCLQSRVDLDKIGFLDAVLKSRERGVDTRYIIDLENFQKFSSLMSLLILKMFVLNGINPKVGDIHHTNVVMEDNLISFTHKKLFRRLIEILIEDEHLVCVEKIGSKIISWKAVKPFPKLQAILEIIEDITANLKLRNSSVVMEITLKCAEHIWEVLQGRQTPVTALFGRSDLNPLDVYTKGPEIILANTRAANFIDQAFMDLKSEELDGNIVRIIEIGGGSASSSIAVIKQLQKSNIPFRYTFTDISAHFFENAKTKLDCSSVEFKLLDIEKDPCIQGFYPHQFDIVIAANVIHATENLSNSVRHVRKLLRNGGMLVLQEMLEPMRPIDMIFGVLDGYWKFTDYDVRPNHAMASKSVWDKLLVDNGFSESKLLTTPEEWSSVIVSKAVDKDVSGCRNANSESKSDQKSAWLIFCDDGELHEHLVKELFITCDTTILLKSKNVKNVKNSDREIFLDMEDSNKLASTCDILLATYKVQGVIYLKPLNNDESFSKLGIATLNFCKYFSTNIKLDLKIVVITRGVRFIQNQEIVMPSNSLVWGMVKSFLMETKMHGKIIDLDPDAIDPVCESKEIACELFDREENFVSLRNRKRYVTRFIKLPKGFPPINIPKGRYTIKIPSSKKITDVTFRSMEKQSLGSHEVEITVKAVGLNFRDIFVILKPDQFHTSSETVGTDYSGVVSNIGSNVSKYKIGDEVYGATTVSSCVSSHIVVNENSVLPKPLHYTFAEASTIPAVFSTSFISLVAEANLQKGETVLIHVASGGVGLSALQIAQDIGATIIATAGSARKRAYLKTLGIQHVFNSRDLSYGDEIRRLTNGKGVNVVLNSLTGLGFKETTLGICAEGARFVEIGKVNIWQPQDVAILRPDVKYTIVNLETCDTETYNIFKRLMVETMGKKFKSIIYTRFELSNIVDALNYLMKTQHIGKVVVTMPEISQSSNQTLTHSSFFSNNATYLITGGLGGIGLEVAKWMADSGARNLVLVGRTAPKSTAIEVMAKMKGNGCNVFSFQVDVGDILQCKSLFENIEANPKLPPLKGVIHSAGVISDAVYANQTWEKYQVTLNAKISGTLNLHNFTKHLNLEHFVLFSSIASLIGPLGQSNHAAANSFLDSFAHYRHSIGLAAQTINWGAWSEVGVFATNTSYGQDGLFGIKPFTVNQGISALKFIMSRPNLVQLGVVQVDVEVCKQTMGGFINTYFSEIVDENISKALNLAASAQSDVFWNKIGPLCLEERVEYIKRLLSNIIRQTLRIPETEQIDEYQQFSELGLDSLMAVEMRNKLQNMIGQKITLNVSSLMDYPTVSGLSKYLADITIAFGVTDKNVAKKSEKEIDVYELARKDSELPKCIQGKPNFVKASQVRNILLTGATGHFGSYLLTQLLKNTSLDIFCLVRGKSFDQSRRKLLSSIKKLHSLDFIDIGRISIINGNITQDYFGLPLEEYNILSENIDAVYHLAAKTNHLLKYEINSTKNNSDIRSINVFGTLNILKFAANIKTKRVFYPSSFSMINRLTEDGYAPEDFPDDDNNADHITIGYSISKFVCEKLMKQAIARGIPCTVIRYSSLSGNSETGQFSSSNNFAFNAFQLFLKMGIAPTIEGGWHFLPIDTASNLTVELLFNDNVQSGVINLFHPTPLYLQDFVVIARKYGYIIKLLSEEEFFKKVEDYSKSSSWLTVFTGTTDFKAMFSNSTFWTKRLATEKRSMFKLSQKCINLFPNVMDRIPSIELIMETLIKYSSSIGILNGSPSHDLEGIDP